jgi:hypothetical protein
MGQIPRRRWKDNIKMDIKKWDGKFWTGFMLFRIGISGGLLWTL